MSDADVWAAPHPRRPLDATVSIPGSKSETNRALLLALLAHAPTTIRGALTCRDTDLMVAGLIEFGARVTRCGDDLVVTPPARLSPRTGRLECGLAGTVMRFLAPVAALADAPCRFEGDAQAEARPMRGLLDALAALGAGVTYHGTPGHLPFTITPGSVRGGRVALDTAESSQFLSALLLTAARFPGGLDIDVTSPVPSRPHVSMTLAALSARGVTWAPTRVTVTAAGEGPTGWHFSPGPIAGGQVRISPDLTNAGPFLAAPLIAGGQVRIANWPAHTDQPGGQWRRLLTAMGGRVNTDEDGLLAQRMGPLTGIEEHMGDLGELVPTVAALAACALTPTRITGIAHLRGHETDRLAALTRLLEAVGARARATGGTLTITPGPLRGAVLDSFADHRLAMFGAILGLATDGVAVRGMEAVTKTFPTFPELWEGMVAAGRGC